MQGLNSAQKLWRLLSPREHRAALLLLGLTVIGTGLEALGISLLIPALTFMTQSDLTARYPTLEPVLRALGHPSHAKLVTLGMLILVAVYAVKSMFLAFLVWRQVGFVAMIQMDLSQRLFTGYLRQPYTFHLQRNSAQLIRNVTGEVGMLTAVASSSLTLISECMVALGVTILLLAVELQGAMIVAILTLASWIFHRLTRGSVLRWGEARQHHDGLSIQQLQQGLGGAKDVKLLGREDEFLNQYREHNVGSARVGQRQSYVLQLPRLWLELLAVVGFTALVLLMIAQGKPLDGLLPTLGMFAAAAFRLMISASRTINALQTARYALPVINTLYGELCLLDGAHDRHAKRPLPLIQFLTLDKVSFTYPAATTPALRAVSLRIHRGTSVGFVGSSGAGKSTLVDIILGLLTPSSGNVRVDGTDIQSALRGWQKQIGYVPQSIFLIDDTLRRNIAFGLPDDKIDDSAVWRAVRAAQLETFVNELPQGLHTVVGERGIRLSGGQRQRIGIARALYHDPSVLVLDEATSSLDTATERGVMDAVRALHSDKTVLIVAHRLSTVEHCDRLFRLARGHLIEEGETAKVGKS